MADCAEDVRGSVNMVHCVDFEEPMELLAAASLPNSKEVVANYAHASAKNQGQVVELLGSLSNSMECPASRLVYVPMRQSYGHGCEIRLKRYPRNPQEKTRVNDLCSQTTAMATRKMARMLFTAQFFDQQCLQWQAVLDTPSQQIQAFGFL